MGILIVAATEAEIKKTIGFLTTEAAKDIDGSYLYDKISFSILITGVGMLATTYQLSNILGERKFSLVINAGIAGCFDKSVALGTTFNVTSESLPELGAEDGEQFISIFDLNLQGKNDFPFSEGRIENHTKIAYSTITKLPIAQGITVNKVHGNDISIEKLLKQLPFKPDIESMEGAAFSYVCEHKKQAYVQLRSISNYVERRNRGAWNIGIAVKNLNDTLIEVIKELEE